MTRLPTVNYGAEDDTTFQWATSDDDLFNRTYDLYRLSQAIDKHDHSANHGLAVARIAAGAVDATGLGALAVQTNQINNLAVTDTKLAGSAVTRNKIEWPLIQPTNDMSGGFRMRETVGSYALGFYVAGNGLGVIGMGSPATINTNLILGQNGSLSVGIVQGAAKLNVVQSTNGLGGGLRLYNSNQISYCEWWNDAVGRSVLGANGTAFVHHHPTNGYMTLGPTAGDGARLHLTQQSDAAAEGILLSIAGSLGQVYTVSEGSLYFSATGRTIQIDYTNGAFSPSTTGALNLGSSGKRWATLFASVGSFSAGISATTGTFSGGITATSGGFSGTVSGTTGIFSGTVTAASFSGAFSGGMSGTTATFSGQVSVGSLTGPSSVVAPPTTNAHSLGSIALQWQNVYSQSYWKPGGGNGFNDSSDDKVKVPGSFRPYERGLAEVLAIRPQHFKYTGEFGTVPDQEFVGLRAQELREILPEMVGKHYLARAEGERKEQVLYVDSSNLIYALVNSVQALHERITALEGANAL